MGNKFIAAFFTLAILAEFLFWSKEVGAVKYILWGITLVGSIVLATNTEDPIQPGKFWACVLGGLACLVIVIAINSTKVFG